MTAQRNVVLAVPSFSRSDAVCNDLLVQREVLAEAGYRVAIYAEFFEKGQAQELVTLGMALEYLNRPDSILIYHHCIYWTKLNELVGGAKGQIVVKYHNITPASFFIGLDPVSEHATREGRKQTVEIAKNPRVNFFLADSTYNASELIEYGVSQHKIKVIAPATKNVFAELEAAAEVRELLAPDQVNLLFVGRCVPNKGHRHLIETLRAYADLYPSEKVKLNIVGSLIPQFAAYYDNLSDLIRKYRLATSISFLEKLPLSQIYAYYKWSDAFLVVSEHEGFCVPVIEAQTAGLPVIGFAATAVADTAGPETLTFEKLDYDAFAVAIHRAKHDSALRQQLIECGYRNAARYSNDIMKQQTREFLQTFAR